MKKALSHLRKHILDNITEMPGYYDLESHYMRLLPGFNEEDFKKYQYYGTGPYNEEICEDFIQRAFDLLVKNLFEDLYKK